MAKTTRGKGKDSEPSPWFAAHAKNRYLVSALKRGPLSGLFRQRNVLGMAYGMREAHGERTDTPALVVYVVRKEKARFVPPSRLIPRRWTIGGDCVEIDVVETGLFHPHAFTARERPAPSGISIGNANEPSAGTLGCVVIDNSDGQTCVLSNNHVLARQNAAALGEVILQPGMFDAGSSPGDNIGTLKRFVTIPTSGGNVDAAIAAITNAGDVANQMKNNLTSIANADHPAVGLLFAGGCNRTIMNDISNVLTQLNIRFPGTNSAGAGQPIVAPEIGMNVEKVGRTTEYTTSTIKEIDVSATIAYEFGDATLDNQFTTGWMSDPGDSGSLVCRGGDGGDASHCGGCGAESEAADKLQRDVKTDGRLARDIRDRYLRHTKIGRWAVELYYNNADRLTERFRATPIDADDLALARKMYDKYADEARTAAAAPERADQKLAKTHMRDARLALDRGKKYLTRTEAEVAEKLFAMAEERLVGKTSKEAMAMLQDEKLLAELQGMAESVPTISTKDCSCRKE